MTKELKVGDILDNYNWRLASKRIFSIPVANRLYFYETKQDLIAAVIVQIGGSYFYKIVFKNQGMAFNATRFYGGRRAY